MNTASQSILAQKIKPNIIPWVGMQSDKCVPLENQPEDIGWNCHVFTLGLYSTDFSENEWKTMFWKGHSTYLTFRTLFITGCISNVTSEPHIDSNATFYIGNQNIKDEIILKNLYIIHSAQKQDNSFLSRMASNNKQALFIHELGAVQSDYKFDQKNVHVIFGHVTSDKTLIKKVLRSALDNKP
jgi:hypothetical protein